MKLDDTVPSPQSQPQIVGQQKPQTDVLTAPSNETINSPNANLSPNSRAVTFTSPQSKNHRVPFGHAGQPTFQHPMQRPVSVQIPRQVQIQQRILQSPFSPQSPHDQLPLSPVTSSHDQFSRSASECSQSDTYLNVSIWPDMIFIWKQKKK